MKQTPSLSLLNPVVYPPSAASLAPTYVAAVRAFLIQITPTFYFLMRHMYLLFSVTSGHSTGLFSEILHSTIEVSFQSPEQM